MPPLFSLDRVSLDVGDTMILRDITLELPDAGITCIVGPSGSGKSSLLRLLNGLERPTSGTIEFRGVPVESIDVRSLRRRVGMVFQRPTVFDGSSLDNLLVADPGLARSAAGSALGRVGLGSEILDRDARLLSGGEAQRLCLARTLLTKPEVVLMDEPTSSLDEASVSLIELLVGDIAADGVRMLWVTHDRAQVMRVADWMVAVESGRIVEEAATQGNDTSERP